MNLSLSSLQIKLLGYHQGRYITKLITSVTGLEDYPSMKYDPNSFDHVKDICRAEIRSLLEHNLSPNETRDRVHRKSHGYISFTEMSKIMCDSWKVIDDYTKSVFEGKLSDDDV